jgi:hypothetical protein
MRCQARVEDTVQTFPNTRTVYHTTKQCEEDASRKYSVDDGDSEMLLCGGCFRRCLTKKTKGSSWLGFFDCSYPPEAKVKGSSWYYWMLSSTQAEEEAEEDAPEEELCEEMAKCSLSEPVAEDAEEDEEAEGAPEEADAPEEAEAEAVSQSEGEEVEAVEAVEAEEAVEEVKPSETEKIKARIAELQAFVKGSRGMPVKEQAKILKEIINLRTQLKKMA